MRAAVMGAACALVFIGCVESNALVCGDSVCPGDYICTMDEVCVSEEAIANCVDKADGDTCTVRSAPGQCVGGFCIGIVCGNDVVEPTEACDDGNRISGDRCDSTCSSLEVCGNGFVDVGELCDCGDGSPGTHNATCDVANSLDETASCRPDCTPHGCGDGVVEGAEQCEPGIMGVSCLDLGFYVGTPTCNNVCRASATGCTGTCGDGAVDAAYDELCDGAPPSGESCLDYGYDRGPLDCSQALCRPAFDGCAYLGWVEFAQDSRGFNAIHGASATSVWAGGPDGSVLQWDGSKWSDRSIPSISQPVNGLWAAGTADVYAATGVDSPAVWHLSGSTWTSVYPSPKYLFGIAGSGSRVIAVGADGHIASSNGGAWAEMTSPTSERLSSVAVLSPTEAFAGGGGKTTTVLLHWTGGSTWAAFPIPTIGEIQAVWGRSASDLYVGGEALMHWNGTSWSAISLGFDAAVTSISGTSTDVFVAFDLPDGTIAQFDGDAWSIHDVRGTQPAKELWAAEGGEAFAASLRLSHYVGSGFTTSRIANAVSVRAVGGTASQILAVGDRGFAMKYDGTFWRRVETEIPFLLRAVSGNVVVGDAGTFGVFDGTRITPRVSGTTADLHAVWKAPNGHSWAVGSGGTIIHYDGISTFTSQNLTTQTSLEGVWGTAANNIYAVGLEGVMVHYDGNLWTPFAVPALAKGIYTIWGVANDNFMIAGDMAVAYQWNGTTWAQTLAPSAPGVIRNSTGTMGGAGGNVFYGTQDTGLVVRISLDPPPPGQSNSWGQVVGDAISVGGDGTRVFAVGRDLGLYRFRADGDFETEIETSARSETRSRLFAASAADVYATGNRTLAHFDGFLWSGVTTPFNGIDLGGTASNNIWIFDGKRQDAARWNGSTWTSSPPPSVIVTAFSVAPGGVVFGAGDDGALVRYVNGWINDTNASQINIDLAAVHAVSATSAFAVGFAGSIIEYSASGWASIAGPAGFAPQLHAVWATPTSLFIAGVGGIAQRLNGTWTVSATPGRTFTTLYGTSQSDVFAAGPAGALMHFDGTRWTPINSRTVNTFADSTGAGDSVYFSQPLSGGAMVSIRRDVAW